MKGGGDVGANWTDPEVQVALVDTQPGRSNNSLPDGIKPVIVIDHHPAYAEYPGVVFLDLRGAFVGALAARRTGTEAGATRPASA